MFIANALVYPLVLALLCAGAGLLTDRLSGGVLPGALLVVVGAAALIALSQLSTYVSPLASATPYLFAALAAAGFLAGAPRIAVIMRAGREWAWPLAAGALAYLLALAPVLAAGRPTFSSYLGLSDSAFHMQGADYLIRHGQDFAHLDLGNSYGQYVNAYYNSSYPSGADTLFGGSALLLGLPLIWAYQPFNAFMLACAGGPAWLLLRRLGFAAAGAALGALVVSVSALAYGYELIGSIKEITALPMILALGALVASHRRWLWAGPRAAIPFALVTAAGVSALGVGFGAWALAAAAVLLVIVVVQARGRPHALPRVLALVAAGTIVALACALPTWVDLSGSLRVARNIASTSNPGNLQTPLHPLQVFGVWLGDSYKRLPAGAEGKATYVLAAVTAAAGALGVARVLRGRQFALGGWLALTVAVWAVFAIAATTWVQAKALVLTSPVVVLLAWMGLTTLRGPRLRFAAPLLGLVLAGGVITSDALQYHASNLAPTARFRELANVDTRFARRGPALFTDFDEYALYQLRDLDVGGPNFEYPPPALDPGRAQGARGYRYPVELDRLPPASLASYPLIVTRRDPARSRPPSAYRLRWHGAYYEVWARRPHTPAALAALALLGTPAEQCAGIGRLASIAIRAHARLVAAERPELVGVSLAHATRPRNWGRAREGIAMDGPGRLSSAFALPSSGEWWLWFQGQIMPAVAVSLDGHRVGSVRAQLGGNSLVPNTLTPLPVMLSAGGHLLALTRGHSGLAPGDGGTATVYAAFLTRPQADGEAGLVAVDPRRWRALCGHSYEWVEVVH
jgi:hypothetical protein